MSGDAGPSIEDVFADALERPVAERRRFVDESCADDTRMRAEVFSLLDAHATANAFLEGPALGASVRELELPPEPSDDRVGHVVGPYRITRLIGAGGMGSVYLAVRADGAFDHQVAIKLIRGDGDDSTLLERFRRERQVLAELRHPNIARLLDGGSTADGVPYLVMEYIDGKPIDDYCDAEQLPVDDRIRLFVTACAAVQHAHRNLVVHRDLKPGNVLVDAEGHVKLLDFGIARVLEDAGERSSGSTTLTSHRLFSPAYASPEQVRGDAVTTASDVYSLGVVLYELLTGRRPYPVATTSRHELERAICEHTPRRPSAALDPDARQLRRRLSGDLDTIVLTALRKEPDRRYRSPAALADDLRHAIAREPIGARPDTLGYRGTMFARRNPLLTGALAALLVMLLGWVATSTWLWLDASAAREAEGQRASEARKAQAEAEDVRDESVWRAYQAGIAAAEAAVREHRPLEARMHLDRAPLEHRGWEWDHLAERLDRSVARLHESDDTQRGIAFTREGAVMAVTDRTAPGIVVWNLHDRSSHEIPLAEMPGPIALSPDGGRLAWSTIGTDRRSVVVLTRVDPLHGRRQLTIAGEPLGVRQLLFTANGTRLLGTADTMVVCWDVETGDVVWTREVAWRYASCLRVSPTGTMIAVGTASSVVKLLDARDGADAGELRGEGRVFDVAFSPDGQRVVTIGDNSRGVVNVTDVATGEVVHRLTGHRSNVNTGDWAPDGSEIITGDRHGVVRRWSATTGEVVATVMAHTERVRMLRYAPDGSVFVSSSQVGEVKLWDARAVDLATVQGPAWPLAITWSPDGTLLATNGGSYGVRVWDPKTLALQREVVSHGYPAVVFHPREPILALGGGRSVRRFDTNTWEELEPLGELASSVWSACYSHDGRWLFSGTNHGPIYVWDTASTTRVARLEGHTSRAAALAMTSDGTLLASMGHDATLRLWDTATWKEFARFEVPYDEIMSIAFSPDDTLLAAGLSDATVALWDVRTRTEITRLHGHSRQVRALAFAPDGRRLATGSYDLTIKLWDVAARREVASFLTDGAGIHALAFSPDGTALGSASADGTVNVWTTR
ncbi:MAG: protein kinase domain-containing protein [Planctomycetota bacterium]|jgi:WD40 repeat protein